ncbi:signal peptidase I [Candidatus Peregrinibacteria bacterium]|jgi:signal peptidase I|nr:signal peptidase I [Candidatus Peregrinibacteria bacterium]MBT4056150.1 signal peptidase I [Candidatus Peregrinibacteria bacterium]
MIPVLISFIKLLMTFPVIVSGGSMLPTFYEGDVVYMSGYEAAFGGVERGDVVLFELEDSSDNVDVYIKRVVGMPGEKISIKDGVVSVDGRIASEPYLRWGTKTEVNVEDSSVFTSEMDGVVYNVPLGKYFVLGDNRQSSVDSRHFILHYVDVDDIKGVFTYLNFPYN